MDPETHGRHQGSINQGPGAKRFKSTSWCFIFCWFWCGKNMKSIDNSQSHLPRLCQVILTSSACWKIETVLSKPLPFLFHRGLHDALPKFGPNAAPVLSPKQNMFLLATCSPRWYPDFGVDGLTSNGSFFTNLRPGTWNRSHTNRPRWNAWSLMLRCPARGDQNYPDTVICLHLPGQFGRVFTSKTMTDWKNMSNKLPLGLHKMPLIIKKTATKMNQATLPYQSRSCL